MHHVRFELEATKRGQNRAERHPLIELPLLGLLQHVEQIELPNQDDQEQLGVVRLQIRKDTNLFQDLRRQVLRLVDDQHAAGPDRRERGQELVQRADQLVPAGGHDLSAANGLARDHAEVEQDFPQQFLCR